MPSLLSRTGTKYIKPAEESEIDKLESLISKYKPEDITFLPFDEQKNILNAYKRLEELTSERREKLKPRLQDTRLNVLSSDFQNAWNNITQGLEIRDVSPGAKAGIGNAISAHIKAGKLKTIGDLYRIVPGIVSDYKGKLNTNNLNNLINNVRNYFIDKLGAQPEPTGQVLQGKQLSNLGYYIGDVDLPDISYREQIGVLEGLVGAGEKKLAAETEFETFKGGLQEELRRRRGALLAPEQALVGERLQEAIPEIEQQLHARGLLTSGELASEISRTGTGLQAGFESLQAQLENEDFNFFKDIGYNEAVTRATAAGQDISQFVAAGQQFALESQEEAFKQRQGDIQRQFEQDIARRRGETQLFVQGEKQRLQKEQENAERKQKLLEIGAESVGMLSSLPILSKLSKGITT